MAKKKKTIAKEKAKVAPKTKEVVKEASVGFYKELSDAFREIKSKNRNRVIKFLFNMHDNGGNQTQAALAAGLGNVTNKKNITAQQEFNNAASEGARLLKNSDVKNALNILQEEADISEVISRVTTKEKAVTLLMQQAVKNFESSPYILKNNIELVAKLKGWLGPEEKDKAEKELTKVIVSIPRDNKRCKKELMKLQEQGYFEDQGNDDVIEGEVVEVEVKGK